MSPPLPESVAAGIRAIADTAGAWRARAWPGQSTLIDAVAHRTGLAPRGVRAGLDAHLGALREPSLVAWFRRSGGAANGTPGDGGAPRVALLAADNLPGVALFPAVAALLAGSQVLVKLPADGEPFFEAWAAELRRRDPDIGRRLETRSWRGGSPEGDRLLAASDVIVVLGHDDTVALLEARHPGRVLGLGSGVSFAYIEEGASSGGTAIRLARETALWDQAGCLSPRGLLYRGTDAGFEDFRNRLGLAMDLMTRRWPPRARSAAEEAAIRILRSELEVRSLWGAVEQLLGPADGSTSWTAWVETSPKDEGAPGRAGPRARDRGADREAWPDLVPNPCLRSFWIRRVASRRDVIDFLELAPPRRAQGMALALCRDESADGFPSALRGAGVSHVAPLGRLQAPPVDWRNQGRDLLAELCLRTRERSA
jgi:hypothetical protein